LLAERFGNVLRNYKVIRNEIEKNEEVYDNSQVIKLLFREEELVTGLKGSKHCKASGVDSAVNEFLEYKGCKVRDKLLKVMKMVFEKREVLCDFRKLIKSFCKKGIKSECSNYRGISWVSIQNKLMCIIIFLRLRDAADKLLGEEQSSFTKGN